VPAALEPDVRNRLREAVLKLCSRHPDPERAQSDVAREIGTDRSGISRLLSKTNSSGGSLTMVRKVSKLLNQDPSLILMGVDRPAPVRKLRELPGYAGAIADAVRRIETENPHLSRGDLEAAADTRAEPEPLSVTSGLLIQLALIRSSARRTPPKTRSKPKT
jgi:hypothetical protein